MPYDRQTAGKGGHSDFVRNPDVQAFLAECDYMRAPSDAEAIAMATTFSVAPGGTPPQLPDYVVASDASKPSTVSRHVAAKAAISGWSNSASESDSHK